MPTRPSILLTDPPLMAWGAGQILFARLIRRSDVLPKWVAWTATIAGAAGVLASLQSPPLGILLALLTVAGFAVWSLATGVCRCERGGPDPHADLLRKAC